MTKEECVALLYRYAEFKGIGIPNLAGCKEAMKMAADLLSQHSLPSDLDEAAEKKARDIFESLEKHDIGEEKNRVLFGLLELEALALTFSHFGAEWMAGQGYADEVKYSDLEDRKYVFVPYEAFNPGDKVIVQIRKKNDL